MTQCQLIYIWRLWEYVNDNTYSQDVKHFYHEKGEIRGIVLEIVGQKAEKEDHSLIILLSLCTQIGYAMLDTHIKL